jgi:hypothetical protein
VVNDMLSGKAGLAIAVCVSLIAPFWTVDGIFWIQYEAN